MSTALSNDLFEQKLTEAMNAMKQCQENKQLESCYNCESCFGCDIRNQYVRSVYENMSKGETGGFDF